MYDLNAQERVVLCDYNFLHQTCTLPKNTKVRENHYFLNKTNILTEV